MLFRSCDIGTKVLVRPSVRKKLAGLKYEPKKGVLSIRSDIDLFQGIK